MMPDTALEEQPMTEVGSVSTPSSTAPPGFDDLYRDEWSALVALGWSLTGSWPVAEDLVQDAFADAYRRWDHVVALDKPGAWVRRAVINRAVSTHRKRGTERTGLSRMGSLHVVSADRASTDRTGEAAVDRVADPAFWAAVRALPEQQRACVALHYLDDLPVAEIAAVLRCRPATVKVHLHRGRKALAASLAALDEHEPERQHETEDER